VLIKRRLPATEEYDVESRSQSPLALQTDEYHIGFSTQKVGPTNIDIEPSSYPLCHRDWAEVDVPGSPELSRLLSAVEMECSNSIPPPSLEEGDPKEAQCISNTELLDLWNGENKSLVYESEGLISSCSPRFGISRTRREKEMIELPLQTLASVFCGCSPSPFNEVYVFPPQAKIPAHKHHGLDQPYWLTLNIQAADLESKLSKLKPLLGAENCKILTLTKELARTYVDQGRPSKANTLFQHFANITQKLHGPTNPRTIDAWLDVAGCLQDESKELLAQSLLNKLHPVIRQSVQPRHEVFTKAMHMMSSSAMSLGEWGRAEALLRHVLQVRLSMSGPTDQGTWKCVIKLGQVLSHKNQYIESEKLLRLGLQLLGKTEPSNIKYMARTIGHLARNYSSKKGYEEAQVACSSAIEALEGSLGPESQSLINLQGRMAWNLLHQGQVEESEALFRTVVNRSLRTRHENPRYELDFTDGLASALVRLGRMDEAASWYERSYSVFAEHYPLASAKVLSACYRLGRCYKAQCRQDDAWKLYEDHIRKMRKTLETENLESDVQSAVEKALQWLGVREAAALRPRDYHRRRFGELCGCLA